MKRISHDEITYNGDEINFEDKPYTGVLFEVNVNGTLLYEGTIVAGYCQGLNRHWYSNGNLFNEGYYIRGMHHGMYKVWYENGKPKEQSMYEFGVAVARKRWDETGSLSKTMDIQFDKRTFNRNKKKLLEWVARHNLKIE